MSTFEMEMFEGSLEGRIWVGWLDTDFLPGVETLWLLPPRAEFGSGTDWTAPIMDFVKSGSLPLPIASRREAAVLIRNNFSLCVSTETANRTS